MWTDAHIPVLSDCLMPTYLADAIKQNKLSCSISVPGDSQIQKEVTHRKQIIQTCSLRFNKQDV